MSTTPERRRITNIVVNSKAQLRLFIPFGLLFVISVAVNVLMYQQVANLLADMKSANDFGFIARVSQVSGHVLLIANIGIVLMAAVSLITWLMYSHRIFGPIVPLRRALAHLIDGKFGEQVALRRFDEFKEVADDINRLSAALSANPHGLRSGNPDA